jgi:hypothetical protein
MLITLYLSYHYTEWLTERDGLAVTLMTGIRNILFRIPARTPVIPTEIYNGFSQFPKHFRVFIHLEFYLVF